jgi:hypothetical protein
MALLRTIPLSSFLNAPVHASSKWNPLGKILTTDSVMDTCSSLKKSIRKFQLGRDLPDSRIVRRNAPALVSGI